MKLPDIYTDWRIVVGVALILLGAGNWIIGSQRTQTYSRIIAARAHPASLTDSRSFDELEADAGGAVLSPLTEQERQTSYATARMDFYHAAYLAGRAMVLTGVLFTLLGFIAVIQRDSRRAFRRPSDPPNLPPQFSGSPRT